MEQKRNFWRASAPISVSYESLDNYRHGLSAQPFRQVKVINVGGGGMLVETDESLAPGTLLMLEICLPCRPRPFIALGQTVRAEQSGDAGENRWQMAVRLVLVDENEQDELIGYVLGSQSEE